MKLLKEEEFVNPSLGDLRVYWNRFLSPYSRKHTYYSVPNTEVAYGMLFGLAMSDLANPNVTMNVGGLEVYEDNGDGPEWCEWYDEATGEDIDGFYEEKFGLNEEENV